MRKIVMALGDIDEWIRFIAAFVGQHKSDHASYVSLIGQHHQVVHQPYMLFIDGGDSGRGRVVGRFDGWEFFRTFDPLLDIPNRGEVFIEFTSIVDRKTTLHRLGIVPDKIENTLSIRISSQFGGVVAGGEQTFKNNLGIHFLGKWLCGGSPGHGGRVDTAVS